MEDRLRFQIPEFCARTGLGGTEVSVAASLIANGSTVDDLRRFHDCRALCVGDGSWELVAPTEPSAPAPVLADDLTLPRVLGYCAMGRPREVEEPV